MDHRSTTPVVHRRAPRLLAALLLAGSVVLAAPHAQARKDPDVEASKVGCRGGSTSDVKVKAVLNQAEGTITVTGVVFSDDDDVWDWRMLHNGSVSARGTVKAKDADRSFRIVRDMIDFSGVDNIGFRADNTVTGEVCRANVDI